MTLADTDIGRFTHEALIYDSDADYVDALVPFLREGLAAGGVAIAVVPERNAALLRDALGEDARSVEIIDADAWYRRPSHTIAQYDAVLRGLGAGTRAWVVGEVRFGDSDRERAEWTRYEAALNRALAHHDAHVICPYDVRLLPQDLVEDARCTHHHVLEAAGDTSGVVYLEPESFIPRLAIDAELPTGAPAAELHIEDASSLRGGRLAFALAAATTGLSPERVAELTVALNEVVTNALLHGEGAVRLQIWVTPQQEIICAVHDRGPGIEDPLVGLCPPRGEARATSLWLVRQLFDHVELVQRDAGGLTVVLTADA